MIVVKSDGRHQPFDRDKIIRSMQVALRKRPTDMSAIEKAATGIVRQLESEGEQEFPAARVGEMVMKALMSLDIVGYIRFTSVYKDFRNPEDFNDFLEEVRSIQERQDRETAKKKQVAAE